MGIWQNFVHFLTLRPMPLSDSWVDIEEACLTKDEKGPVNLISVRFKPEKDILRKYISPGFLEKKINEISDLLMFYCTEEARESPAFLYLQDQDSRVYGDITVNWYAEGTGKRKGLYVKLSDEIDETLEYTLRQTLSVILAPFESRPEIGFSLEYKMGVAHSDWEPPEKYRGFTF
jgi:predicted GNAT superfamily acetyltransferase